MVGTRTDSNTGRDLGPTYMCSTVVPLGLPTAAPRMSTLRVSLFSGFCRSLGTSMESGRVTLATFGGSSGRNTALTYWAATPAQLKGRGRVLRPPMFWLAGLWILVL